MNFESIQSIRRKLNDIADDTYDQRIRNIPSLQYYNTKRPLLHYRVNGIEPSVLQSNTSLTKKHNIQEENKVKNGLKNQDRLKGFEKILMNGLKSPQKSINITPSEHSKDSEYQPFHNIHISNPNRMGMNISTYLNMIKKTKAFNENKNRNRGQSSLRNHSLSFMKGSNKKLPSVCSIFDSYLP